MKVQSKIIFIFICSFLFFNNVKASDIYYTNANNVNFTQKEYEFLSFMFWEGCQDLMTEEDYNNFITSDIINGEITISEISDINDYKGNINTYIANLTEKGRNLKIVSSCSSVCNISLTATWQKNPTFRGYDIMGARFENTSLLNTPTTTISASNTAYSNDIKNFNNGFGVTVKLPTGSESITINQFFKVKKGGHIYG